MSYIFGEGTGTSYGDLQAKRRIAQQLQPKQQERNPFMDAIATTLLAGEPKKKEGTPIADPRPSLGFGSNVPKADVPPAMSGSAGSAGGLDPMLSARFDEFSAAAKAAGHDIGITSGFRSPESQAQIIANNWHKFDLNPADRERWVADVAAMGPVEAGRKWEATFTAARRTAADGPGTPFRNWIALPGRSQHQRGMALDLRYSSPDARAWAHENAKNFGMVFPLSNEPWHIELINGRAVPVGDVSGQPITPAG